jgi:hypothetical protein
MVTPPGCAASPHYAVPNFCRSLGIVSLTESGTGKNNAINALLVRLQMEIDKDRVAIVFDNDLQITTDGTVASISESLRKIMW